MSVHSTLACSLHWTCRDGARARSGSVMCARKHVAAYRLAMRSVHLSAERRTERSKHAIAANCDCEFAENSNSSVLGSQFLAARTAAALQTHLRLQGATAVESSVLLHCSVHHPTLNPFPYFFLFLSFPIS